MSAPGEPRHRRVRGLTAGVCVIVASLLLPIGIVTVWFREQVLDTETFVSTAGTVARDPAVQREVSDKVSRALIRQLDVESNVRRATRSVLPDAAQGLAAPLAVGAETAIHRATEGVVASERFEELWEVAVRGAHENALRLAAGEPVAGAETRDGRIAVNLDPVVDAVVARLPGPIAALIPPTTTGDDIVLFRSSDLATVQPVVRAVDDWWWAVPLLSAVLFAAAVTVASRRRRAVLWVGGGLVLSSTVTFVALVVSRRRFLDAVETRAARAAATAIFDAVLDPLRIELWVTLGIGVALAATAIVAGFLQHQPPIGLPVDGSLGHEARPAASSPDEGPAPVVQPATTSPEAVPGPARPDAGPAGPTEPTREPTGTPRASS